MFTNHAGSQSLSVGESQSDIRRSAHSSQLFIRSQEQICCNRFRSIFHSGSCVANVLIISSCFRARVVHTNRDGFGDASPFVSITNVRAINREVIKRARTVFIVSETLAVASMAISSFRPPAVSYCGKMLRRRMRSASWASREDHFVCPNTHCHSAKRPLPHARRCKFSRQPVVTDCRTAARPNQCGIIERLVSTGAAVIDAKI
jgi:hypothetical protein